MNNKKFFYTCTSVLLSVATGLSNPVNAEGFSPDSVSKEQSTQVVQSGANAVADPNAVTIQDTLTETLVKKLGITSEQAQGGAGALFQVAKGKLDAGQFAALSKAVPDMDSLLSAAPKQSGVPSDLAGGVSSVPGENNNPYGNLAGLASTFKGLNLSPDRVDEFVPVVVDYVRANGGALNANILQSVLYGGF